MATEPSSRFPAFRIVVMLVVIVNLILAIAMLQAFGRPDIQLRLSALCTVSTVLGTAIGVQAGVVGAAVGTSLGLAAVTPLYVIAACRQSGLRLAAAAADVTGPLIATVVMASTVLLVRAQVDEAPPWAQFATTAFAGVLSYVAAVLALFGARAIADLGAVLPLRSRRPAFEDARP